MLEFIRKNAGGKMVWIIIGAISLVFVFFGMGGRGGGGRVITVNGEEISMYDYQDMVQSLSRRLLEASPDMDQDARQKLVRQIAVRDLVTRTLAHQFGRNLGLAPTDEALAKYIREMPEFKDENGQFSKDRYEAMLRRRSVPEYEKEVRRDMTLSRVSSLVGSLSQVYAPEALETYHFSADQVKFDFLFFPSESHLAALAPTEKDLADFFAKNQEQWRLPTKMKVEYVTINPADFLKEAEVTEGELRDAYEENKARFTAEEDGQSVTKPFGEARADLEAELKAFKAREKAVAQLEDLIVRTETNPDLKEAAKSMGLSAETTGFFTADDAPGFFEGDEKAIQKAFKAEVGRVADPAEEQGHLTIYTPLERVDSHIPPLDDVRAEVGEAWRSYEAMNLATADAEAFLKAAAAQGWAEAAQAAQGAQAGETGLAPRQFMAEQGPLSQTAFTSLLAAASSVAAAGQVSPVPVPGAYEGREGCFALRLAQLEAATEDDFNGLVGSNLMINESMRRADAMQGAWMDELVRAAESHIVIPAVYQE